MQFLCDLTTQGITHSLPAHTSSMVADRAQPSKQTNTI